MVTKDSLIIGAGVNGLATAEALLLRGAAVTLLECGAVGQESSWAGGGILSPLCPWDYPAAVTQLSSRGAALFGAWANGLFEATGIDPEYEPSGMLVLPPFDREIAGQWCVAHGVSCHPSPAWGGRDEGAGLLLPDVAQVRNPRVLQALRARVEQLGGRIVEQCAVREFIAGQDGVSKLLTSCGEFSAENYIVTAGAWSKVLLGEHALQVDIKPIRGQMLLFKFDAPPLPHIVLQAGVYLIPRRDGHLLVGSTLENVGFDKSTTEVAREMLLQRAFGLLPALRDMPLVKHWAGLRPGSPDNIPTIGRHPHLANLYINSGHFRYGVTMAPASVEVLLNEIDGESLRPLRSPPEPASLQVAAGFDATPYRWR